MRRVFAFLFASWILFGGVSIETARAQTGPSIAGCPIFPLDNVWNTRIDQLPVDSNSSAYINSIGPSTGVHPDFGSGTWDGAPIGIPYKKEMEGQAKKEMEGQAIVI